MGCADDVSRLLQGYPLRFPKPAKLGTQEYAKRGRAAARVGDHAAGGTTFWLSHSDHLPFPPTLTTAVSHEWPYSRHKRDVAI